MSFLRTLILCLWLGALAGTAAQAAVTVVVVSSERGPAYGQAMQALAVELERAAVPRSDVLDLTVDELLTAGSLNPRLFVALGSRAVSAMAESKTAVPVLSTLVPRSSFEQILRASGRKASAQFSALYLDLPLQRHLALIREAMPQVRRVAVLWGPQSQWQGPELQVMARARGLELVQATVGQGELLFPKLQGVLERADVLLAVADPEVYNSSSIQNILLTAFRARVPLIAFSPAYVRAGAVLALHVTPAQLGQQAGAMVREFLQGGSLPSTPVYSRQVSVAVNEHVARSLGLTLVPEVLNLKAQGQEAAQ